MDTKTLRNMGTDMISEIRNLCSDGIISKEEARELLGINKPNEKENTKTEGH